MRIAHLLIFSLSIDIMVFSELVPVDELSALARHSNARPDCCHAETGSEVHSLKCSRVEDDKPMFMKLAFEGVLETCGVMICLILMASRAMKFCNPPSPGNIPGLIALLIIVKLIKSIMTAFRTFPRGLSCDISCSNTIFAPGLKGAVQKLGIMDMVIVVLVVAAGITAITYHFPFCVSGNIGIPDDVFMAFTGLLILNIIQFGGTIGHMCVWGHAQSEDQ